MDPFTRLSMLGLFDPDQILLMPPSLNEWLSEDQVARFVAEVVDHVLDLAPIYASWISAFQDHVCIEGWGCLGFMEGYFRTGGTAGCRVSPRWAPFSGRWFRLVTWPGRGRQVPVFQVVLGERFAGFDGDGAVDQAGQASVALHGRIDDGRRRVRITEVRHQRADRGAAIEGMVAQWLLDDSVDPKFGLAALRQLVNALAGERRVTSR